MDLFHYETFWISLMLGCVKLPWCWNQCSKLIVWLPTFVEVVLTAQCVCFPVHSGDSMLNFPITLFLYLEQEPQKLIWWWHLWPLIWLFTTPCLSICSLLLGPLLTISPWWVIETSVISIISTTEDSRGVSAFSGHISTISAYLFAWHLTNSLSMMVAVLPWYLLEDI